MGCTPVKQTKTTNSLKKERKLSSTTLEIMDDFQYTCQQYTHKRTLGRGKYGRVFLAESLKSKQQVAVKALSKNNNTAASLADEIVILAELDHPNIVKYYKHYESGDYVYLVMEYCEGEELFSRIVRRGKLSEEETSLILEKALRGVSHCHELGVVHCDLKPENIMLSDEGILKLVDFGLAMKVGNKEYQGIAGTPYYIAPEIIKQGLYTRPADIWALGIIMHTMLTGYVPVTGRNFDEIKQKISEYTGPDFSLREWKSISPEAKDLLKKMLNPNHVARITAVEALGHPWFMKRTVDTSFCDTEILEALQRYSEFPELKKSILNLIVRNLPDTELNEFRQTFLELDKAKTGLITSWDLETALNKTEKRVTRKELEELTKKVNQQGLDCISYSEFLAALIAARGFLTEERLVSIYKIVEQEETQQRVLSTADSL